MGRVIIKVGTSVLTGNQATLNRGLLQRLVSEIVKLRQDGREVVLVTSGAVAAGNEVADFSDMNERLVERQMYAAVGQARLMHEYERLFRKNGVTVGQALLTREDFQNRERFNYGLKTLRGLLYHGVVPIINENDAVSVQELSFGDNDLLAATTAIALQASTLILLTNQEGLLTEDPKRAAAKVARVAVVGNAEKLFANISMDSSSSLGAGGMLSKVKAATLASSAGVTVYIASGLIPENITGIMVGQDIGTKFLPRKNHISAKERWILCAQNAAAAIIIDAGAVRALRSKKSLLMVGVRGIRGAFGAGQAVEIKNSKGDTIGFGVVNYSSEIMTQSLESPHSLKREIVHVDNLRLL